MPEIGERKTKGGVTGEWDGSTWRRVDAAPSSEPAVGTRKTKNGIVGEWDGTTWRKVAEAEPEPAEPEQSDGSGALATGGVLATMAAAVPGVKRVAEHVATSPTLGKLVQKFAPAAGALNLGQSAYDVVSGRKGVGEAGIDAAKGEALRQLVKRAPALLQRAATPIAGMSAPLAAGGLAGLAGSAGFLGALQHDANRDVPMDYTKRNLTEDIARALMGSGATDAQMDDPTHPAFRPDDSETVTAPGGGYTAALLRLLRAG
jgi:hypothetical protein